MVKEMMIIITILLISSSSSEGKTVQVSINETAFTNVVDKIFHGVAMDMSVFRPGGLWKKVNLKSQRLKNILKSISPCYFRIGGTAANWMFFDLPIMTLEALKIGKANMMTKDLFDEIVELTLSTKNRLLYGLNAELRYGQEWNPTDAIRIFEHCKLKGYGKNIDWELGNEPNHISPSNLSTDQVANDVKVFYDLVKHYPRFHNSLLVGPDVGWNGVHYIGKVANISGQYLDAYTIHPYYFNGKTAKLENYTDSSNFIKLDKLFDRVREALVGMKNNDKPWWLGETSTGHSSGTKNVADRFVSGFLNLEKLGFSAAKGVKTVIRQTIFNGHYALLNLTTFEPFPDFWMMWTHLNLVGRGVFNVTLTVPGNDPGIRVYAQCVKPSNLYKKERVVVFALNVNKTETYELDFSGTSLSKTIDAYVFTPDSGLLTSKEVLLNGKKLQLVNDDVPKFPKSLVEVASISIKPLTFGFYVFKQTSNKLCADFIL